MKRERQGKIGFDKAPSDVDPAQPAARRRAEVCNQLDGKRWLKNSISVWDDLRKSSAELRLKHPAMFPVSLAERLIETFVRPGRGAILDPFAGTGTTLVAAERLGQPSIGLEISPEYVAVALRRLAEQAIAESFSGSTANGMAASEGRAPQKQDPSRRPATAVLYQRSATELNDIIEPSSIDLCVTSPPYWNILNQRRTADLKSTRNYGNLAADLGTIADYEEFLDALAGVFERVFQALKPGAYCCIVVMDLRKKDRFFPLHSDLASRLIPLGFRYDDLIIWNRRADYNNLRPLGYPAVFRVNKVHEFILLMQKPKAALAKKPRTRERDRP